MYQNSTTVSCVAPSVRDGLVDVFVTNDGVLYSSGFQFMILAYQPVLRGTRLDSAGRGIVWAGPALHDTVPLDFDERVMPPRLSLAVVLTGGGNPGDALVLEAALAAIRASPLLLPFTALRFVYFDADAAFNAAPADKPSVLRTLISSIRSELLDEFVGVIGPYESSLSVPLAAISASSAQPVRCNWRQGSHGGDTACCAVCSVFAGVHQPSLE